MRTTLDIDDSVLEAVKELARQQGRTAGSVASELIRRGLTRPPAPRDDGPAGRHGFRPFPATIAPDPVSNDEVNRLRDDLST